MISKSLRSYIHDLIREHKTADRDGYHLYINDLPIHDIKVFLSHILHPSDYEYAISSSQRTSAALHEYGSEMQSLINNEIDDIYADDMRECGYKPGRYSDNGEVYWSRSA